MVPQVIYEWDYTREHRPENRRPEEEVRRCAALSGLLSHLCPNPGLTKVSQKSADRGFLGRNGRLATLGLVLIPNLVETVKGYAGHEKQTFEDVVEARNRAMAAQGPAQKGPAEGQLGQALGSLFALAEGYPELRAVDNFLQLQGTLSEIEEALQNARRYYNAVVRDLNTAIEQVPSNLVAGLFGFTLADFFQIEAAEREAPRVDLDAATH